MNREGLKRENLTPTAKPFYRDQLMTREFNMKKLLTFCSANIIFYGFFLMCLRLLQQQE